jgi:hypothetical protein
MKLRAASRGDHRLTASPCPPFHPVIALLENKPGPVGTPELLLGGPTVSFIAEAQPRDPPDRAHRRRLPWEWLDTARRGDLVQQRLEAVVILPVQQGPAGAFAASKPANPAPTVKTRGWPGKAMCPRSA